MKKYDILNKIKGNVIAIVRSADNVAAEKCLDALVEGCMTAIEFPMTARGAVPLISRACDKYADKGVLIGAGSVLDAPSAALAIHGGAEFLVTPTLNTEVIALANGYCVPVICGVATPTEAYKAMTCGADVVKLFPASQYFVSVIKEWRAPLPGVEIVPTGGVSADNIADWQAAGAFAYGVGGSLTAGMKTGDFAAVTAYARRLNGILAAGRGGAK